MSGKKHPLNALLYALFGAKEDHASRNHGDEERWFRHIYRHLDELLEVEPFADCVEWVKKEDVPPHYASTAAIQFALETDDGLDFLRLWNEGDFEAIRAWWDDIPDEVFIGADPLFKIEEENSNEIS